MLPPHAARRVELIENLKIIGELCSTTFGGFVSSGHARFAESAYWWWWSHDKVRENIGVRMAREPIALRFGAQSQNKVSAQSE